MGVFDGKEMQEAYWERVSAVREAINNQDEEEFTKYKLEGLIDLFYEKYHFVIPVVHWDQMKRNHETREVPAPDNGWHSPGSRIKEVSWTFRVPLEGDLSLLEVQGDGPQLPRYTHFSIENRTLVLQFTPTERTPKMEECLSRSISAFKIRLGWVEKQLSHANTELKALIVEQMTEKREALGSVDATLKAMGIHLKKDPPPRALQVPAPELRKKIMVQPPHPSMQDPFLNERDYQELITILHEVGKVFERLPSLHENKGEEALRDVILMNLVMRVQGTATGETYNLGGKVDVLLRHENSNLFVAECKFWRGQQQYLDTITQLLGYLTWRDSKAAVIVFVRDTQLSTVLNKIETTTPDHPNFVGFAGKKAESWFEYRLHVNGDRGREVQLTVLAIHVPRAKQET